MSTTVATKSASTLANAVTVGAGNTTGAAVTRSSTTLSFTFTSHGYSNTNIVTIDGFNEPEFKGTFTISNVATNTFDVTGVPNSGPTTGTGTGNANLVSAAISDLTLTTALGATILMEVKNGSAGPTVAADIVGLESPDGLRWTEVLRQTCSTTNNANHVFSWETSPNTMYFRCYCAKNTAQSVTFRATAQTRTNLSTT